ncbi:hypothetical protein Tco_0730075 [Tanacetum coccineum]|uniref:Uncharacterized protein n=1 Tax=Tanacetum coccineum TaxID=301880 RepID=A0ABQ4YQP2_9ASTR
MATNEETNAAGIDTRPPMLNGPTPHPMITDPPPTDSAAVPAPREKIDSEFSEEENKLEMADTQAEIILSQGLPRHIFNNLNQTSTAKEIWINIYTHLKAYEPHAKKTLQETGAVLQVKLDPRPILLSQVVSKSGFHPTTTSSGFFLLQKLMLRFIFQNVTELDTEKALDVDEGPNAAVAFMANLSSTSATNNPVNEVHSNDNQIFDNVDYQLNQEMHQEEHLDSDAERDDDNTILYGNIEESWFYNLSYMKKMNDKPGHIRPVKGFYEKLNALMFVPQQELSREQAYWLPANERASQTSNPKDLSSLPLS